MSPKLAAVKVTDCHSIPVICVVGICRRVLEEVKSEGLDLSYDAHGD
jgi:hypothetical protein